MPEWDLLGLCSWCTNLHPATWKGKGIVVVVKDTGLLDWPFTQEFQITHNFSYIGYGKGIPICFTKDITLEGCLGMFSKQVLEHDKQCTSYTKLLLPQGNWTSNTSPPQRFPSCTKELWESNRTLFWRWCTGIVPLRYNITGIQQYILDWSGNQEDYSDSYAVSTAESWNQGMSAGICGIPVLDLHKLMFGNLLPPWEQWQDIPVAWNLFVL